VVLSTLIYFILKALRAYYLKVICPLNYSLELLTYGVQKGGLGTQKASAFCVRLICFLSKALKELQSSFSEAPKNKAYNRLNLL